MARATWFCIDIECSGPVPSLYDMISIGAVPVIQREGEFTLGDTFYAEIRPTAPQVDPEAMKVNGLDLEVLKREGRELADVLRELSAFVKDRVVRGSKAVFVGHNAPFDWSFVSYAYHVSGIPNPFGYKALDTKALAVGVLGLHWFDTNKERLDELLGLPPVEKSKVHRADYDAWYQAHILMGLLRRLPVSGGGSSPDARKLTDS
jgi:DNA polymerase III epsilon subunit-like protein